MIEDSDMQKMITNRKLEINDTTGLYHALTVRAD
jgi:hypothetical protein